MINLFVMQGSKQNIAFAISCNLWWRI